MILTEILNNKNVLIDDPVTTFAKLIVQGQIIAGETEILACKRHLEDLMNQDTEEFPYLFDYSIAEEGIIKFITKYTLFTDGKLAGNPVDLVDFQFFILGSLFGWTHRETGYRRFRQAYIQVARKNTKTYLVSWVSLYMLMGDGYFGSQVYTAANAKDQAKIAFNNCVKMVKISKSLLKRLKVRESVSEIYYAKKYSILKALSSETKNLDGFDPHCGVIDEYHAHKNNQIYKLLDDGAVQQDEPLIFIITTAGFDLDCACFQEYEYCKEILERKKDNETRFIYIAEMDKEDDIEDPKNWFKSNPLFRALGEIEKLRIKVKEGLDNQSHFRNMLTKTLNKWVDMKENGYMNYELWKENGVDAKELLEICKGKECYVGLDLSQKHDLSSVTFEFPLDKEYYAVITRTFIPGARVKQKEATDGVSYSRWIEEGFLIECEGLTIRNQQIEDFIVNFSKEHDFKIKEIDYDPYSANQLAQNLSEKGYITVEIRQGMKTLSEPTKDFREQVYNKNVIHENNPVLNWNVQNAVEKTDHNGNILLDKSNTTKKIDGLAAGINAHTRAMTHYNQDDGINISNYAEDEMLDKLWGEDN
ncbi:phage terminase large subunit-like protein [Acetoanaerobium pronyense]|uniref:Phage terminase large subunit-like protein n=1 Tax=Acetoanaerobium pronyense TaxID=1482736 RepID=A0ABS4KI30_9FIRM|nr:terminase TerL endonuclease subunit [Acetoanaerobium pronyense]MBP2027410.1 phage terminase large subunit-like protein [Acetoanaerobium pronyense]